MLSLRKTLLPVSICLLALFALITCTFQFAVFISYRYHVPRATSDEKGTHEEAAKAIVAIMIDVILLAIFTIQHSVMANPDVRKFIARGFGAAERSLYVLATSASLLFLVFSWQQVPWYMWKFTNTPVHYLCFLVHCIIWTIIYGGCLQMDLSELIGVKQVYYYLIGSSDPIDAKNPEMRRLYAHMRHPSFIGFCVLFWLNPVMSADRFVLAGILSIYMMFAWNVDHLDCHYQKEQLRKKKFELGLSVIN